QPLTSVIPPALVPVMNSLAYAAPAIEALIAIGLLTQKFRQAAIYTALAMHSLILVSIGPLGRDYNSVVWPWNLAMCAFLVILFWKTPFLSAREILWPSRAPFQRVVLLLLGFLPALSFFNLWDAYLSVSLYAGRRNEVTLFIDNALADRLPKNL